MGAEPASAAEFYRTRQGSVAARLLRVRLRRMWPDLRGQTVLGLGHATPYLPLWREQARCIALTPAQLRPGTAAWPAGGRSRTCVAEEGALPFADLSIDRVLLVHGLEMAENARALLREVWRVLRDDGRVLLVAPNRRGLWAHVEATPFGHGQPYSPGQVARLLRGHLFQVERRDAALFLPPVAWRPVLRGADLIEAAGRRIMPTLAGVTLTEASKNVWGALPAAMPARHGRRLGRRVVLAEAA